ncbi:MAG: hypothetical protein ACE5IW_10090 [bacterium]
MTLIWSYLRTQFLQVFIPDFRNFVGQKEIFFVTIHPGIEEESILSLRPDEPRSPCA